MAQPIYKFFRVRFSEAWYQLSEEEQNSLETKVNQALQEVGGKRVLLCSTNWSSEQWSIAGVEEFPNIEAVQNHIAALNRLDWWRYIESTILLGTKLEPLRPSGFIQS